MIYLNKPAVSQPDYDSKRLKRYGGMSGQVFCLDADVASLEAENERLRAWIKRNGMHGLTPDNKSTCFGEIINKGKCICGLSAILNREQEKQP